jgi:hypothetical protein
MGAVTVSKRFSAFFHHRLKPAEHSEAFSLWSFSRLVDQILTPILNSAQPTACRKYRHFNSPGVVIPGLGRGDP